MFPKFPNPPMQSPKIYYVCVELKTKYILINMSKIRKNKEAGKGTGVKGALLRQQVPYRFLGGSTTVPTTRVW